MPKVKENQLLGNQGEALASYLLSKFCLVRPVAGGTDVGIDLYCETVTSDQPNNNFLVQVKSIGKEKDSHSFKKEKIEYWWRQTLPVFVFLISPDIDYGNQRFRINVINLTESFLEDSEIMKDSKTLKSHFTIHSLDTMTKFVNEIVPVSAARLWLKHGIIVPAKPGLDLGYLKYYPVSGCSKFARHSLKFIGRSASMLLLDLLNKKSLSEGEIRYRNHLEEILATFCEYKYGNYDMHYAVGKSRYLKNQYPDSIPYLEKALNCIETDKKLSEIVKLRFQPIIDEINEMLGIARKYVSRNS